MFVHISKCFNILQNSVVIRVLSIGALVVTSLLLATCVEQPELGNYTCANGTPTGGNPDGADDVENCERCATGYHLDSGACNPNAYACTGGDPADGQPDKNGEEQCDECGTGYTLNTTTLLCDGHSFTCAGGDPISGQPDTNGEQQCNECDTGYTLNNATLLCEENSYDCPNGHPKDVDGSPPIVDGQVSCDFCNGGFVLDSDSKECRRPRYICNGGTKAPGAPPEGTTLTSDVERCTACDDVAGEFLFDAATSTCTDDFDNDGALNVDDVDDDNDGLIEIHNLDMLFNMQHHLNGTSYRITRSGDDNTTGGPTSPTDICPTDSDGDGTYLCGYELTRSLDFENEGSYASGSTRYATTDANAAWRPISGNAATATNRGWTFNKIGTFNAYFEGNGYTIANLYIRNAGNNGFIANIGNNARIHNVGFVDAAIYPAASGTASSTTGVLGGNNSGTITASYATGTIDSSGSPVLAESTITIISGGLVGVNDGDIIASYAAVTVTGSPGDDLVGGLAGTGTSGVIIASYATGHVGGGDGNDDVGGIIGESIGSAIIASYYAIGNVTGAAGDDNVGGVAGEASSSTNITASYATSLVDGGANTATGTDNVGGLVGSNSGEITSSYGFGSTANGNVFIEDRHDDFMVGAGHLQIATPGITVSYAGDEWNSADSDTLNAWDVGDTLQPPALRYADYDGAGPDYSCDMFPDTIPGTTMPLVCDTVNSMFTLLPGQR